MSFMKSDNPKKLSEYTDRWTDTEEYTDGYWQGDFLSIILFIFKMKETRLNRFPGTDS
jgi:hypothetical protein